VVDPGDGHAAFDPPPYGVLLVLGEVVARPRAEHPENRLQGLYRLVAGGAPHIVDQLLRHLLPRQDVVHVAAGDGAARPPVEGGQVGRLRDRYPAFALDRLESQRAVAAGDGEHDAD